MLEHLPHWLGAALRGLRAGPEKLAVAQAGLGAFARLRLESPAFADGARLPERFTADGDGVSPPLLWYALPAGTAALALIVEDADAPAPQPLVHALAWRIDPAAGMLGEGAIGAHDSTTAGAAAGAEAGRHSLLGQGWLPPDPPNGHGPHHYAFQLFALDAAPELGDAFGRSAMLAAMRGHVLAAGLLTGTYSRGEAAPVGPVGAAVATGLVSR